MTRLALFALVFAIVGGLAAACGDDGQPPPTPEGPTTLSLTKTMAETGEGEFRFTLELTNEGNHSAVNVATSDVWEGGLEVTAIGSVDGQQPKGISDIGLEFIFGEFEAGKSVQLVYMARCRESGEWENVALTSAANAEAAEATVRVECP